MFTPKLKETAFVKVHQEFYFFNLFSIFFISCVLSLSVEAQVNKNCQEQIETKIIRGRSMVGVLYPGDEIKVDMNFYNCHTPERGDLVIVKKEGFPAPIIKSLLVLPGDYFFLKGHKKSAELIVNGLPLKSARGDVFRFSKQGLKMIKLYQDQFKGSMPKDSYFIFGTRGNNSRDSTKFGPILKKEIIGKVVGKLK